ncbi:MAG: hypothetical protein RL226_2230, partial [Bacteroidota bacterium]
MTKAVQSSLVIVILHTVGIVGILLGFREWILPLTPINLLISGWMVLRHEQFNRRETAVAVAIGFG